MAEFEIDPTVRETVVAWRGEEGREWLAELPDRVARLARTWGLTEFGRPLPGGTHSHVVPVSSPQGPAVLKVTLLDDENRHEAAALRLYDGRGAVLLYEADPPSGALLLERCEPGAALALHPDRDGALAIACEVLRRLRRPAPAGHPFSLVTDLAGRWAAELGDRARTAEYGSPLRLLAGEAAEIALEFSQERGADVIVNRDAHRGNLVAAQRQHWLLIDPKPLVGDAPFDGGYLIIDRARPPGSPADIPHLLDVVAGLLQVDRERLRRWCLLRAVENVFWAEEAGSPDREFYLEVAQICGSNSAGEAPRGPIERKPG